MPQSLYPPENTIDGVVDIDSGEMESQLEHLQQASERINKQLGIITGLELEEGDI